MFKDARQPTCPCMPAQARVSRVMHPGCPPAPIWASCTTLAQGLLNAMEASNTVSMCIPRSLGQPRQHTSHAMDIRGWGIGSFFPSVWGLAGTWKKDTGIACVLKLCIVYCLNQKGSSPSSSGFQSKGSSPSSSGCPSKGSS